MLPESCLRIWTVSFDSWLWIFTGKAISLLPFLFRFELVKTFESFLLLLLYWFGFFEFFTLFFSISRICDRTGFVTHSDEFYAWIAERRFNDDDSALNLWESTKIPLKLLNLLRKWLGFWNVLELFLDLWIWSVTEMREKVWSVCDDVALILYLSCEFLTLCAFYSMPCGLWTNGGLPRGNEHLRGLGLEIGPTCNFMKLWD